MTRLQKDRVATTSALGDEDESDLLDDAPQHPSCLEERRSHPAGSTTDSSDTNKKNFDVLIALRLLLSGLRDYFSRVRGLK